MKTSQGANYRQSVVHIQRVSHRWRCADSLKDCRSFRHGEWEKIDGSNGLQICTLQCGSALLRKLGAAKKSCPQSWKAYRATTQ